MSIFRHGGAKAVMVQLATLAVLALVASACGDDDGGVKPRPDDVGPAFGARLDAIDSLWQDMVETSPGFREEQWTPSWSSQAFGGAPATWTMMDEPDANGTSEPS